MPVFDNNVEQVIKKGCNKNSTSDEKNSVIKKIYDYENDRVRQRNLEKGNYYSAAEKWRKMNIDRNPLDAPDGEANIKLTAEDMQALNLNLLRQALKDSNNPSAKYMLMALQDYQSNPQQISDYAKNCLLRARSMMLSNPRHPDFKLLDSSYQQIEPLVLKRTENIATDAERPVLTLEIDELKKAVAQYKTDKTETGVSNPIMERLCGFVEMKKNSGSFTEKELFDFLQKSPEKIDDDTDSISDQLSKHKNDKEEDVEIVNGKVMADLQNRFYYHLMSDPKRGKQKPAREYLSRFPKLFKAVTGRDCPEAKKMAKDKYLHKTVDKEPGPIVFDPPGGGECGPAATFLAFVACANQENMNSFRECYIDEVVSQSEEHDREKIGEDFDRDLREFIYDGSEVTPFLKNVVLAMRRYSVKTEVEVNMAYIMEGAYFLAAGNIRNKLNKKMQSGDKNLVTAYEELRDEGVFSPETFAKIQQSMAIKFEKRLAVRQKVFDKIDGEEINSLQQAAAALKRDKAISDKEYNEFIDGKEVYLEKHPEVDEKLEEARLKFAASALKEKDVENAGIYEKLLQGEELSKNDWNKVAKKLNNQILTSAAARLLKQGKILQKDYNNIVSNGNLYLNQHPEVALKMEDEKIRMGSEYLKEHKEISDEAYDKLTEEDDNLSYKETEQALSDSGHAPTGQQLQQATREVGPEYHHPKNFLTKAWRGIFGMVNHPRSVSAKVEQAVREQKEDGLNPESLKQVIHHAVDEEVREQSKKVGRFSFGKKLAIQLNQDQLRRVCEKLGYEFYAEEIVPWRKRISRGIKALFIGKAQTGPIGKLTNLEQGIGPKIIMKMFAQGDLVINRAGQPSDEESVPRVSIDLAEPEEIAGEENYCNIKYTIDYRDAGHASQSGIVKVPKKDMNNDEEIMNLIVKSGTSNKNQQARADLVKYGHDEYMYHGYEHDKLVVLRNIPKMFTYHWQLITPNQQAKNLLYGYDAAANDPQLVHEDENVGDWQKDDDDQNNSLNAVQKEPDELNRSMVKRRKSSVINESTMYGHGNHNTGKVMDDKAMDSHFALIEGIRFICNQDLSRDEDSPIENEIKELRSYLKTDKDSKQHQFSNKELDEINQLLERCKSKFAAPLKQYYKGRTGLQSYNMVQEVQIFQANCTIVQNEISELKWSSQDNASIHY